MIRYNRINKNCAVCSYHAIDYNDWEQHVTGESHVEKVKLYMPIPTDTQLPPPGPVQPVPAPINFVAATPSTTNLIAEPSSTNPEKPQKILPLIPPEEVDEINRQLNMNALTKILSKNKKEWRCSHCNIICQSLCSWNAHIVSKKHNKNKHKFHLYPGISKEHVQKKYLKSFVRANESIGNEFIEDGVIFFCKRCNVRMQTKLQLDIHMKSNMHKMNFPMNVPPQYADYMNQQYQSGEPSTNNQHYENQNLSTYGYAGRTWVNEQQFLLQSQAEKKQQLEQERERQLVEQAKSDLLRRFPYYALSLQGNQDSPGLQTTSLVQPTDDISPENIPMPVEPPSEENQTLLYDPLVDMESVNWIKYFLNNLNLIIVSQFTDICHYHISGLITSCSLLNV